MKLESRNVFIDTQAFVKMSLDFNNNSALKSFFSLCKSKNLRHLTTSVVKKEVECKIEESINNALINFKNFKRQARLLEKVDDKNIQPLFVEINNKEVQAKAKAVFGNFLKGSNTQIIDASDVQVEDILALHFQKKAPFSEKKKSEFPDAISLTSLLQYIDGEKAYVISKDPDHKSFCEFHESLYSIETLEQFLDVYNEHESAVAKLIKDYLVSIDSDLKIQIEDQINHSWAYNEGPWEDSEVDEFNVIAVHDINPTIVWVNDEECLVSFDVDVDFEYTVSGPDFTGGFYDKEDGRTYTFGSTTHSNDTTQTFSVEVTLFFEEDDGKLRNIDVSGLDVLGLSDGISVYIDEHGDIY